MNDNICCENKYIIDANYEEILFDYICNIFRNLKIKKINKNENKKPIIILGPSGVGKDTMINKLKNKYKNKDIFYKLPSYTTRSMRPGEKEGVDYYFVTKEQFEKMEKNDELFGIQKYNDNSYASNKKDLKRIINEDKIVILNYNIETANMVVKGDIKFNYIAIMPPSEKELENRLIKRGTKPEEIEKRMKNSKKEMNMIEEADYINFRVVNDNEDECFKKLENYIKNEYAQYFNEYN